MGQSALSSGEEGGGVGRGDVATELGSVGANDGGRVGGTEEFHQLRQLLELRLPVLRCRQPNPLATTSPAPRQRSKERTAFTTRNSTQQLCQDSEFAMSESTGG